MKVKKVDTPIELAKQEQERTTRAKQEVLKFMSEKSANVKLACKRAGVSRTIYYIWRKEDPEFRNETNRIIDEELDYVEDQLRDLIDEHNPYAIGLYLKSRHPKYKPQLKIESHSPAQSYEDQIIEEENARARQANAVPATAYREAEYTQPHNPTQQ